MNRTDLVTTLHGWHAKGATPPCWAAPRLWTMDDDPAQHEAARACQPCPAILECRTHGLEHPGEAGVYGGLTEKQRMRSAGPPMYTGSPIEGVEQCGICLHPMHRGKGTPPVGMVSHHGHGLCKTCASFVRRQGVAR